jgi:GNAT superfamily N-acetyltransferase
VLGHLTLSGEHQKNTEPPGPPPLGVTRGEDPRAGWVAARELGGYPELEWTYPIFVDRVTMLDGRIPAFYYEPLSTFEDVQSAVQLHAALTGSRWQPTVSLGFRFYECGYRAPGGRLPVPQRGEPFRGRHFVQAVAFRPEDGLQFRNSWGPRWGDHGYGYVGREYFEAAVDTAIVRWSSAAGPSSAMLDCLEDYRIRRLPRAQQIVRCWPTPNPIRTYPLEWPHGNYRLIYWAVASLTTGRTVDVFEIRNALRIVARAHLAYPKRDTANAVVKEFFVLPSLRQRGIGSRLEEMLVEAATHAGCEGLDVWIDEGDSQPRLLDAVCAFLRARGYEWRASTTRRPTLTAVATKDLSL